MTLFPVEKREVLFPDPDSSEKKPTKPKKEKKKSLFKINEREIINKTNKKK